ncbi:metallophosphoesterase [Pedobacter psychrophilus]|uniref:Metallophosphoesterase n=1 Tax=Pedobacter psychrophilus TaxID=1826909 RepID=A0A179DEC6_9SPHI|nr:calcineurin-like phosphoesterase family protein [Pedobacter psychrophilus]OAQ39318.1 metallophosphoesterase [Pedobacter psychrophilus]
MKRRSFIQSLGLITGGAFISLKSNAFTKLKRAETISGSVKNGKKGIKDVVISDGFSVVKTDINGNYSLTPNEKALSIFMSTPAGYEFKTSYNVAQQYEKLGSRNQYDFMLTALKRDDKNHHFIVWADPQVRNKKDVDQMMATSVPDTIEHIKSLGEDTLVHGICVGDIAWDYLEYFQDYNKAVEMMGIPFFQALGNHDMNYREGGDETSDRTFKEVYGPTYYSFNRGKAHYVVLDDVRYLGTEREYDGFITQDQLDWLAKDLSFIDKDALLIISLHIPVHNSVKNNTDFYEILKDFKNIHVLSGHTHFNVNNITGNVYEHNHGTVCGAWWTGPICTDGTPRGYGVYEVKGNDLEWYYKPTGLEKQHQHVIYIDELTNQKRLLVNVWNWDPEWKVEYELDGKNMGFMEQQQGYDPLSVKLYKGDKLPAGRTFPEPSEIDHLFIAHFNSEVKKVKVTVMDRFGNSYIKEADA